MYSISAFIIYCHASLLFCIDITETLKVMRTIMLSTSRTKLETYPCFCPQITFCCLTHYNCKHTIKTIKLTMHAQNVHLFVADV